MNLEHRVIQPQNRRPVRFRVAQSQAMIKCDSRFEVEDRNGRSFGRLVQELLRARRSAADPSAQRSWSSMSRTAPS